MKNLFLSALFSIAPLSAMEHASYPLEPHPWDLRFQLEFYELFSYYPETQAPIEQIPEIKEEEEIQKPSLPKPIDSCLYPELRSIKSSPIPDETCYKIECAVCHRILHSKKITVFSALITHYRKYKHGKPPSLEERKKMVIYPSVENSYVCKCPYCTYRTKSAGNINTPKQTMHNHIRRIHGHNKSLEVKIIKQIKNKKIYS